MKIVVIANGYPDKRDPQWGCFERDQALALQKLGHQVSILYIDGRFRTYWRKIGLAHYKDNGLSIYGMFLIPKRWLSKISHKVSTRMSVWMMNQVYKSYEKAEGKPDIIYAHYIWNIAYASILKEKYGIPLVGIEHWSGLTGDTLSVAQHYRGDIGYPRTDKLLAVSESLKSHIYRHFGKESIVVYDMLGQEFVSAPIPEHSLKGKFTFVAIGSLIQRKGYDILIEAFRQSQLSQSACKVVIVGAGPEYAHLKSQIQRANLQDSVSLAGRKNKEEIISILAKSHAFILSSRAETFGVVCIEALSQGLPCIAASCGGPEEFINEQNGILVPSDNVEALSEAMVNMYNNYETYDSVAIAEECKRRFAPQVIAEQLTQIFVEVVNNQNKI